MVTGYGNEPGREKSVAEEEDVGVLVDVDVGAAEEVAVLFAVLLDCGRSWRPILSGCVQTWTRNRVWDHVHR